jgi:hypothetical protein
LSGELPSGELFRRLDLAAAGLIEDPPKKIKTGNIVFSGRLVGVVLPGCVLIPAAALLLGVAVANRRA